MKSKVIAYALRHNPDEFGLSLDEKGFVNIDDLISSLKEKGIKVTYEDLVEMINTMDKERFEIVDNKIRALYGHSVDVEVVKYSSVPPDILYHGTSHENYKLIINSGLKPMDRRYVHLSTDVKTAIKTGKRRDDDPIVLCIDARTAYQDGINFYYANDNVWLCDYVDTKYINVLK